MCACMASAVPACGSRVVKRKKTCIAALTRAFRFDRLHGSTRTQETNNGVPAGNVCLHRSEPGGGGIAEVPEAGEHTSIKERVDHTKAQGRADELNSNDSFALAPDGLSLVGSSGGQVVTLDPLSGAPPANAPRIARAGRPQPTRC